MRTSSTIRKCPRCGEAFDTAKELFHKDGRRSYHKKCWTDTQNELSLGLTPSKAPSKKKETVSDEDRYICEFCLNNLGMTKSAVDRKLKELNSEGIKSKSIARALDYFYKVKGNPYQPYGLWIAERYYRVADKYFDEREKIAKYNKENAGLVSPDTVMVFIENKRPKRENKIKEVELD